MSILSLGYLHLTSPNLEEWSEFAAAVLGFMPSAGPDEAALYFRWDTYPYRLVLTPADEPAVSAIGFEVGDDRDLATVVDTIEATGRNVTHGTPDQAAARLVSGFARFADPAGLEHGAGQGVVDLRKEGDRLVD